MATTPTAVMPNPNSDGDSPTNRMKNTAQQVTQAPLPSDSTMVPARIDATGRRHHAGVSHSSRRPMAGFARARPRPGAACRPAITGFVPRRPARRG